MRFYKAVLFLLVFVLLQGTGFCADYAYKKLPSGQTVIVKEIKDNPIVTINTWVKTGSINENEENSGVAHFLEHLFFKGSKNVRPGEFDKLLESKGAVTNAATSKDYTQFYITIPSSDFDLALKLHSDMLLSPLVPRKELEKERFVVLEEIARGLDNPSNVLYSNLFKLIYSTNNDHPYKRPVIGSKDVISSISREKIMDFYNEWYIPSNMVTVVAGDIDSKYALAEIEKAFSKEEVKSARKTYPQISQIENELSINEEKDVAQGYMAIAYKAPKFVNSKDAYALDILSVILGGSNSSILNKELKEKRQLVNSIGSSYSQYLDDGLFIVSSTFEPNKIKDVKNEIFGQIELVKGGKISKEQVQKAKNMIKTSTEFSRESVANIANEMGYFTFYFDSPKMYDEYLKQIDKIALSDVIKAANKYLIKDKTAISTVMPEGFVEISDVKKSAAAARLDLPKYEVIEKTDNETKYLLGNGAQLIVRKNHQNSIVAIDIFAKGGAFLEGKPGVEYLAARNARRGTKKYSYEELIDFLDENGIRLSYSSNSDAFNISLLSVLDKANLALSVLDETVNNPLFLNSEIEKTKKDYKTYVNSLKDKPLGQGMDVFNGVAYKGYPYADNNQVTVKNIDNITRDEIAAYYDKVLDAKNILITVVGNVDDELFISRFNEIFKNKNNKKIEIKDFKKESFVPQEDIEKKVENPSKETTWILHGYKTGDIYDIKELATLKVIDSIMGTGMSSRLFKSLRENLGLAYQVGSQIAQYGNDGAFIAYIGTNYKNEKVAKEGIASEFNKLKTEFVSSKELEEAKDKLLGNMVLALETNMDRAAFLAKYSIYGYDLNFLDKLKDEIKKVSASDILNFANKYFACPHIEVVVGK